MRPEMLADAFDAFKAADRRPRRRSTTIFLWRDYASVLKRTVSSRLAMSGANAAITSAALGHLSPASARAYVHLTTDPVRVALEKALGLDEA